MLASYVGRRVSVVTEDGRNLVGLLHSADQLLNLVLSSSVERELSLAENYFLSKTDSSGDATNQEEKQAGETLQETPIGVMMIRGSDVVSVGLIDIYEEAKENIKEWKGFDMPKAVVPLRYS